MGSLPAAEDLKGHAVICAMRHLWGYRGYETLDKASTALRRKCKGVAKPERDQLLQQALALNNAAFQAAKRMAKDKPDLHPQGLMNSQAWDQEIVGLMAAHSAFHRAAITLALHWGYYWGVLR